MIFITCYMIIYIIISLLLISEFIGRWFLREQPDFAPRKPEIKFAVLIAARNEETVIAGLVRSLQAQHYPKELYDIYVLVNNTTDHTKEYAEHEGAIVISCPPAVRNKGQALKFAFETFWKTEKSYDAYCIFDADNLVNPEFLQKMNDCYLSGSHVAQGYRDILNPYTNSHTFFMVTFFGLVNHFYNETHHRLGLSIGLNGTGLMIGADVLRETGYDPKTMVEDMEYTAVCALNDIRITWVKDAIVLDEQPDRLFYSLRQRRRWNAGQMQCANLYTKDLLKKKTFQSFDTCFYLLVAYHISIGYVITLLCTIMSMILMKLPVWMPAFSFLLSYSLYLSAVILCCLTMEKDLHRKILKPFLNGKLLLLPIHYLCWGLVAFTSLILPPKTHASIPHKGAV